VTTNSYLLTGHLMHSRRTPVSNHFTYPLYTFLIDLDDLAELDRRLALFGYNRPNIVSVYSKDHLGDPRRGIKENVAHYLATHNIHLPGGKIILLTNPRIVGYGFNPVSFYYCYDAGGELACIVAEVNNTLGEQHPYLLTPECALPVADGKPAHRYWADKQFYVSPFIEMDARYEFTFSPLSETMQVQIDEFRGGERFFQAQLWGRREPLTHRSLLGSLLRYPFMTLQVMALIHWQAFKLSRLGAPWIKKPSGKTLKEGNLPNKLLGPSTP